VFPSTKYEKLPNFGGDDGRPLFIFRVAFTAGKGAVYSYDPVGSFERERYRAGGTGASLLQPLLDSEVYSALWRLFPLSFFFLVTEANDARKARDAAELDGSLRMQVGMKNKAIVENKKLTKVLCI
jgi:20S proteasome alpha/beta subunit